MLQTRFPKRFGFWQRNLRDGSYETVMNTINP